MAPDKAPTHPGEAERLGRWERAGLVAFFVTTVVFGGLVEMRSALQARRKGDLNVFLRAAWAVRSGADLYAVTDDNGFHYHYPPLFAILLAPLADPPAGADHSGMVPYPVSVGICYVLNLLFLALAVHALARALEESGAVPRPVRGGRRWWALRVWPIWACVVPVGHTLMRGQVNMLLLALLCGAVAAVIRGRAFRGGLYLAGAIAIKIVPAFLVLFPLWRRDGRFLAGCAAGLVVTLVAVPVAALGPARTWDCYERVWGAVLMPGLGSGSDQSRAEELTNVTGTDSQSILAVIHNTQYPQFTSRPTKVASAVRLTSYAIGGLLTLATLAVGRRRTRDPVALILLWGCLTLDMLLLSPVCHLHYFALALPLAAALIAARWQRQESLSPGAGLVALFVLGGVANLLPHLPALVRLRDGGLAMYGTLALWLASVVTLWWRTHRVPADVLLAAPRAAA
jgi:hypothetical protein